MSLYVPETTLNRMTLVVAFDKNMEYLLMCKRAKNPWKGKINFVGGKLASPKEEYIDCARREFKEETGICDTSLFFINTMRTTYIWTRDYTDYLEVYTVILNTPMKYTNVQNEVNELLWVPLIGTKFFDTAVFAGDGNILNMVLTSLRVLCRNFDTWYYVKDGIIHPRELNESKKILLASSGCEAQFLDD